MKVRQLLESLDGLDPESEIDVTIVSEPYDCMPWLSQVNLREGNRSYVELEIHYFSGDGWES